MIDFNSRSHVESDGITVVDSSGEIKISIHALTWRATSRPVRSSARPRDFNSRSHVESDMVVPLSSAKASVISIHALTWRATRRER